MRYYVRTTGERKYDYDLEYEVLLDTEHKPIESFIDQLRRISNDNCVLLEDDLQLCKNFKEEIEKAIARYPDRIINFFTDPLDYYETHLSGHFAYNQCTYYPKGMAKLVADEMEKVHKEDSKNPSYASLEKKALLNLSITHIKYRPCLVQHKDNGTLIGRQTMKGLRVTPYFKDWLDELGISYEECFKREVYDELQKKKEKFLEEVQYET